MSGRISDEIQEVKDFKPDVVFVGAGPVGLFTAIQLALYCPDLTILMLEKYSKYQRTQTLFLDASSFQGSHPNTAFQAFLHALPRRVKIQELEDKLLEKVKECKNIQIQYEEVKDCTKLATTYKSAKYIIGSDGSASVVHRDIFQEYQIDKQLQHIAQLTYKVTGKTRKLRGVSEVLKIKNYSHHFIDESVGVMDEKEETLISLRAFIDDEAREKMQGATFKNPYRLSRKDHFDDQVKVSLKVWKTAREEFTEEKFVPNSDKVTVFDLDAYVSIRFTRYWLDKNWFLVGDSAFGVPFFRSLNNGMLCGSQLAIAISALEKQQLIQRPNTISNFILGAKQPLVHYEDYVQTLAWKEATYARVKSAGIGSVRTHFDLAQLSSVSHISLKFSESGQALRAKFKKIKRENEDTSYIATIRRFIKLHPNLWGIIKWLAIGAIVATILYFTGGFALIPWIAPYAAKAKIIGITTPIIGGGLAATWNISCLVCCPVPVPRPRDTRSRLLRKETPGGHDQKVFGASPQKLLHHTKSPSPRKIKPAEESDLPSSSRSQSPEYKQHRRPSEPQTITQQSTSRSLLSASP